VRVVAKGPEAQYIQYGFCIPACDGPVAHLEDMVIGIAMFEVGIEPLKKCRV
jgi:hypothetical protein